jgi:hypothetical protein
MEKFEEVEFQEMTEQHAEGLYDGRKFTLTCQVHESDVVGNFTDQERLFIFTQWEMLL